MGIEYSCSYRFFFILGSHFSSRPTLDLTAIYNTFEGFAILPKVGKSIKKELNRLIWLPKCLQEPSKIHQKTKPKNNTKNHRIWLPKWSQNDGAKRPPKTVTLPIFSPPETRAKKNLDFFSILRPPGLPLASFLAPFGCLWASFWRLLAPFGSRIRRLKWYILSKRLERRNFAEILPRFCRERAENPPRTRREPAV